MVRQGDVLLMESAPEIARLGEEVPLENGALVLAHGEATGHSHRIVGSSARLLRVEGVSDMVLALGAPARLVHEEHGMIELAAGTYVVRRQREYSPGALQRERLVED
jgi:hypothetical protein